MRSIGLPELIVILVILLIVGGAGCTGMGPPASRRSSIYNSMASRIFVRASSYVCPHEWHPFTLTLLAPSPYYRTSVFSRAPPFTFALIYANVV